MADTDQLTNRLSTLEGQFKQLLLRLQKTEGELKDLKNKHRIMKSEFSVYKDLVGNRKFG